jgi:hypothetical protein
MNYRFAKGQQRPGKVIKDHPLGGLITSPTQIPPQFYQHSWNTSPTFVRFQVLMAASMKMTVFWAVAPCSLVEMTDV